MATPAAKSRRRAIALNRLDDLAVQVAEHFKVEVPNLQLTNRDPELAQIQQTEATGDLLEAILRSVGVEPVPEEAAPESEGQPDAEATDTPTPKSARKAAKKSAKKTTRRK